MSEVQLKRVFGFAVTAIATEHWFTFFLSSIPATERFWSQATEEEKEKVRKAIMYGFLFSLGFGLLISIGIRDFVPIVTAFILGLIVIQLYNQALEGKF